MAEYWGMKAIAKRMGVSTAAIRRWHDTKGFLMYLRHRPTTRPCWYTNDQLVHTWELSRCIYDRSSPLAMTIGRKRQPENRTA